MEIQRVQALCQTLLAARNAIAACERCCAWVEEGHICMSCGPQRDQSTICVVETWHDMIALERASIYKGTYHILGGSLSPLDGRGPEDLSLEQLNTRMDDPNVQELIIATSQTPEGEATASLLHTLLASRAPRITSLARGVPVGASLEYTDRLTLSKAFLERRTVV